MGWLSQIIGSLRAPSVVIKVMLEKAFSNIGGHAYMMRSSHSWSPQHPLEKRQIPNTAYCKGFRSQVETFICMFQTVKNSQQWLDVQEEPIPNIRNFIQSQIFNFSQQGSCIQIYRYRHKTNKGRNMYLLWIEQRNKILINHFLFLVHS